MPVIMKNRLAALDGLRALAALGVLWIHTWTFHGNPRYLVKGIDITSILALGGNGVDLFFAISGFCMYYFYTNSNFSYSDFWTFIKKRWIRLSPAFYAACLIYIIVNLIHNPAYPYIKSILTCLIYLNGILFSYNPESILWSLTPEWQFYIIVPFLLIYQKKIGFKTTFLIIAAFMFIVALLCVVILKSNADFLTSQIIFRYFEFMWGILAGRLLLLHPYIYLKFRSLYFVGFILVTYVGRIMISKPVLSLLTDYYNIFKLSGFICMGLGFSGIIYMALTSKMWLKLFLGNPVLKFIGKISFSFYLWHGLIYRAVGARVIVVFPKVTGIIIPLITFFISIIILIPISTLSFNILEKPFLARHKQ